ncbi:exodeoxyribonuclease V subunit gamma [Aeromicrobium senzhongii]|uniref:RecBCD enzyme subunit RecC n=1 Tax=Aeromicrobium senzhongii TaxID=2663859 RepID=A0ABX6SYM1_9ACTN|nr:exodeoxyribonuclease V subunit gamma [Aeromicrobium senzhongii]MTB87414.1 exodeoxyribonuclease V subunit gamma [Aeromicrobium senzhongii]QNL95529.1 exodeoxyribonuclease V subunit gamma [Aeromicrobium senzhongii]
MTFHLHRAERTDVLADALAGLLAEPSDDPFATELVVVAALGTERWLSQRLSHRLGASAHGGDGVTAGIRFARPQSIVAELLGEDDQDPWRPDALTWRVLEVLETGLAEPWLDTVARHLGQHHEGPERALRRDRRLGVARHLAGRLHAYARQRPAMTAAWTDGRDEDGTGGVLPADVRWQAEVWRRVRALIDAPSPDERIASTAAALRRSPEAVDLPPRVSLFGHNRLPLGELQVLAALAEHRDVHLWLPHPSPTAWDRLTAVDAIVPREQDTSAELLGNPLLAALGRDVRELQRSIAAVAPDLQVHPPIAVPRPDTLLGRVQSDVAADRAGAGSTPPAAADRTIQVHACHGRARQVDVLRDVIVGLLQDDPTLEPRDILVMVPDIEAYAPLFHAAFGQAESIDRGRHHPGHRLQVMLADRAASRTNPLLALTVAVLELARRGRATNAEVLDLLATAPVRQKFDLDDAAIERITQWVETSGVRWGFDAEHRRRFGLPLEQNTWRAGLDRLVCGVAATEDPARPVAEVLPLDDVPSGDVDLVGRLVTFVDALERAVDAFGRDATMAQWARRIDALLTDVADVPHSLAWQRQQVDRELERLDDDATVLRPGEVLSMVRDRWAGRPSRANFRTGSLTVCTMVPMRSVPHRVVCLVGLDDGTFPRATHTDGDDVLARRPLTGERDARAEDRQLLLDAVMSATETLVVTYTGADEHRGQPRPPAVPLGELLDQVRRTAGDGVDVVTHHPLQPFDPRNLLPGAVVPDDRPFSFDPAALAGARASLGPRREPGPFLPAPLPAPPREDLALSDLVAFVQNPIRSFWRQRLDVSLTGDDDLLDEDLPITLDGLQQWHIGQRLLDDAVRGVGADDAWSAVWRAGMLPPGRLGTAVGATVGTRVATLVAGTAALRSGDATTVDIDVALPDGRRLLGTVEGVHDDRLVTVSYSTVHGRHRLRDWVRLLALAVQRPDVHWVAHTAGKVGRGSAQIVTGLPSDPDAALGLLADLVDLRDAGLLRPLPLPVELALTYTTQLRSRGPEAAARIATREWQRDAKAFGPPPDRDADEIVRVWGAQAPFSALVDDGFTTLAPRLWDGALDHQREAAL